MVCKREGLLSAARDFTIERAETWASRRDAQRLRHRVFCLERGILPQTTEEGFERDEFDDRSHHIVLRRRGDSEVIGTVRLVVGMPEQPASCLPMQRYCPPNLFRDLPIDTLGEISRFAISKQARREGARADCLLRLALMQGVLSVSRELGLSHWCALMERSLVRLLQATGVHFAPLGPMVEAFGLRQPSIASINMTMASGRRQQPEYYRFITGQRFPMEQRLGSLVA